MSLQNLDLQSSSSHGQNNSHDTLNLNSNIINPIDKLYLMQNSYFNSE